MATVLVGGLVACTPAEPASSHRAAPALRLDASVTQFRYQEGTRQLKAGVTNAGKRDVRVTQATIAWDGFAFPTVPIGDGPVPPGQTAAFTISYGAPQCRRASTADATLVAVVDGRTRRLPLRVEDPGLLRRLRARACAQTRLDRVVGVRLRPGRGTVQVGGEEYLPADLVLRRRPGSSTPVRVVDLGGSVLVDLVPRSGRLRPTRLTSDRSSLRVPLLVGSAHRCDAHALSQSSQTFLLSAYLQLGHRPTQRQILAMTPATGQRINAIIHRDCR